MTLFQGLLQKQMLRMVGEDFDLLKMDRQIVIPDKYNLFFPGKISGNKVKFKYILNLIDDVLLRREEYEDGRLDKFERFDRNYSLLVNIGLDQTPVIDELSIDVIKQFGLKLRNIWPEGKKAVVCLTHDVDSIDGFSYFWLRKMNWFWHWFKTKLEGNQQEASHWLATLKQWNQYKNSNDDPMDSFDKIQELENSYGFRSTFFFMSLPHGLSREGRRYSVKKPRLTEIAKNLLEGGWEIGLHAAYHNHLSLSSLKEQKQRLEDVTQKAISGCRHHYLRVRYPESWEIYAQAGFKYSSNMGWGSNYQGFRAGTCVPYQPLREHSLLEIPFQLMDTNPIADTENYMNKFNHYLNSVKAVKGCLVINFHQEHFHENAASGVGKVYRNILDAISKDPEIAVLTMNEVYKIIANKRKLG